jgi:hypothetical protein
MKKVYIVLIAVVLIVIFSFLTLNLENLQSSQGSEIKEAILVSESQQACITGKVIDTLTKEPLSATIEIVGLDIFHPVENGNIDFCFFTGIYTIKITSNGYESFETRMDMSTAGEYSIETVELMR